MSARLSRGLAAGLAVLAAAAMGAGCGHEVSAGPGGTVRLALDEYRLAPATIDLRPGRLTIVATNVGRLTHNLVVSRGSTTIGAIRSLGPGQSGRVTLRLDAGTYLVGSTLLSDEALGLYGHLVVAG